jgi:hypothetical protein
MGSIVLCCELRPAAQSRLPKHALHSIAFITVWANMNNISGQLYILECY